MHRTKEFRRDVEQKNKSKVIHIVKDIWHNEDLLENESFIGKMSNSRHYCSCDICRNPRHRTHSSQKDKLTIQERKANEDLKELENEKLN